MSECFPVTFYGSRWHKMAGKFTVSVAIADNRRLRRSGERDEKKPELVTLPFITSYVMLSRSKNKKI